MKKILTTSAIVMGFAMASAQVQAAPEGFYSKAEAGPTGSTYTTGVTTMDCDMLSEVVKLTVSANVAGAMNCAPINNVIEVAACHRGGTRDYISCATWDSSTNAIAGCANTTGEGTEISFSAFFATSAGGVMQTKSLADAGAATCDDTNIESLNFTTD